MTEAEAKMIAETLVHHYGEQEAGKICCQCHTAYDLIGEPPIFNVNDKRVYFCQHCWDIFLAESTIVEV